MAASGGAGNGAPQPVNIYRPQNVLIGVESSVKLDARLSRHDESASSFDGDCMIILIKEELEKCPERKETLHTLEQKICDKIRALGKKHFSSFKDVFKISFRSFVEENADHFDVENDGQHKWVVLKKSKKTKKKKKKKKSEDKTDGGQQAVSLEFEAPETSINELPLKSYVCEPSYHTCDEEEEGFSSTDDTSKWQTVRNKRANRNRGRRTQGQADANTAAHGKVLISASHATTYEAVLLSLIRKHPSDSLIFKENDDGYKRNTAEFIKDVTSLYNMPCANHPAYIVTGVQACSSLPHSLQGLQSSTDESVYQSMFLKTMFSVIPNFRYREICLESKRIGIVEVDKKSSDSQSIIISDDMAASGLRRNQLWSRERGRSVCADLPEPKRKEPSLPSNKRKTKVDKDKRVQRTPVSLQPSISCNPSYAQTLSGVQQTPERNAGPQSDSNSHPSYADSVQRTRQPVPKLGFDEEEQASIGGRGKAKELMKALNNFQKFDFVLVSGSMSITSSNVQALAAAPWVAVYDFNFLGRDTGLLSMLEEEVGKRRSLSILTWCDNCKGITEKGTQWWSLRGRREISDSRTPEKCQEWFNTVKDKLEKLTQELAQFAVDCTVLKVLILWPDNEVEARCMHKFLSKLQENLPSEMLLCYPDSTKDHSHSKAAELFLYEYEESTKVFHVDLENFCAEVEHLTQGASSTERLFQLPSVDSKVATLNEKDNAWLVEDLDVLYLQNPDPEELTDEGLEDEADTFFRGGTIKWSTIYDAKYDHFDVQRVVAKEIITYIEKEFINDSRTGMVTVYHAPGAGGSTMARRVLWDLHKQAPCVHVKQRSGSSVEEIATKLTFLYDKCRAPVIALMDGEDESRIKQFSRQLQRHNVVIVYAKRYPHDYSNKSKGKFYLSGFVNSKESEELVKRYTRRCVDDERKTKALWGLNENVQKNMEVRMYEYGMAVYLHEFQGVRAFVRGHLQLEGQCQEELQLVQKCLGFLALVYYYGQSSLPCQFFVNLLGKMPNYKVGLDDFPHALKVFVVEDKNEGRGQHIRIGHYIIAKEILEQILSRRVRCSSGTSTSDRLSPEAKRHLKDFCIDFISQAAKKPKTSQTIGHILTSTFIFRDYEETSDVNEHGLGTLQKKKPQFSQVMSDLDSDPPYQGRLEILQKLCKSFPQNPSFRAHLGRFYTCCRPEEEKEAEKNFKEALRLCREESSSRHGTDIDDKCRLTLMHIYHMYGMFFQAGIDKLIKAGSDLQESSMNEDILDKIVEKAISACDNFVKSRNVTPAGHEESYIYTNEIHVRLRTCDFVHRQYGGGMRAFLDEKDGCIRSFVVQSVTEIDNLIMECYDMQMDQVFLLQKYASWFHDLFSSCSLQLQKLLKEDRLAHLRLSITATKLKFRSQEEIVWTDSPIPEGEITQVLAMLEDIFREVHMDIGDRNRAKVKLDLDYRDWIVAIRHVNVTQEYRVEKVLERVRRWHDQCRSPQSTYYLFTLLSLLGIGTASCPGNTECLVEAQMLLESMQKLSKVIHRSRFPREWLGREDNRSIKRLVTNSNISYEERRIKNFSRAKLAVCKGTICAKFQKSAGFITLDHGLDTTSVKVFFIPARAENIQPHHAGARVQFHLAFTLDKGYEAYEVTLLGRYRCSHCPQRVEMTWEQDRVTCKCGAMVTKNEHSVDM